MVQNQIPDNLTQFFVDMEHKWLDYWEKNNIVKKYLKKNIYSKNNFSFLDGPITANNPMGVHHAWGRTYKDLWQKFHNLLGFHQRFQSGFDCQGLWVEVEVEKELKLKSKKDIENLIPNNKFASITRFVDLCKARVEKFAEIQTEQSKRLGYFMDWDNSYFTMSDSNNYMIWHFLKVCHENGWIYKGHESVPWCPRCETAISQHEMLTEDYKEVIHESVCLKLPIVDRVNEYLLVWTTTPWTIPANIAVAVDADINYSLVQDQKGSKYWVAEALIEKYFNSQDKKLKTVKGIELKGLFYEGPFDNLDAVKKVASENAEVFHSIILTDPLIMPISKEEGTGLVHTAVSAGTEDFRLGKKYGLPMIPVIADNADYLPYMGFLAGKNAKINPRIILDFLENNEEQKNNFIFKIEKYKHRYPGCWRCKTELVWKVADEWYIAMDKNPKTNRDKRTLRQKMIKVAKKITWIPEFGLERELDWLKNMHDWLISKKNRYWGLALPIYECVACGHFDVIGSKEELKTKAVEGWSKFEGKSPHKPYIDEVKIKCNKCGKIVSRIEDVGNPWLDAGIVPFSTLSDNNSGNPLYLSNRKEWENWFPVDFITESFPGQFKNWFYAMIAMSSVLEDSPPFKQVLGFATLVGEDGRPMHKSWGNAIEFNEGADSIGVDVMRWMYIKHNASENLAFGYKRASEIRRQFYLLLWNTYKFFKLNIEDKEIHKLSGIQDINEYPILDRWILYRFKATIENVKKNLLSYKSKEMSEEIENFVSDFSLWYIRRSRERVGMGVVNTEDRQNFLETCKYILVNLSIALSPLLPFISEEIFISLTGKESVHLEKWPDLGLFEVENDLVYDMHTVRQIVEIGHRVRKENKIKVRQPLSSVRIGIPKNLAFKKIQYQKDYEKLVRSELNIKNIVLTATKSDCIDITYDLTLTKELRLEGEMRDLVREIQICRKNLGFQRNDLIKVALPSRFKIFEDMIRSQVNAREITYSAELKVEKMD